MMEEILMVVFWFLIGSDCHVSQKLRFVSADVKAQYMLSDFSLFRSYCMLLNSAEHIA